MSPRDDDFETTNLTQVDALCDELESQLKATGELRLGGYLDRVSPTSRGPLLKELVKLAAEFLQTSGVANTTAELVRWNPGLESEIVAILNQPSDVCLTVDHIQPVGARLALPTARQRSGLHVRCPHCRNPIELLADAALESISCAACGSDFSLTAEDSTSTRDARGVAQVGHFKLVERLGLGAFGAVWKAQDTELDRTVAVKIPRAGQLDKHQQEMFLREARSAAQLRHPNIVPVYEVGREGETLYIVSEFVRGVTLADQLTAGALGARESAALCAKLADALHHAHEQGVIHRDLKPGNVMIDEAGEPHLMDFGLARREAGEITMTLDGQILGTPAYMSPEQAQGESHVADSRSDVYSLGVILFELLTGELPFRGNSRMLIHQVIHDEPPSPRKLNGGVPKDLETITLKCLQKDAKRRFATAAELGEELRRHLAGRPILSRPISGVEQGWRWCKRKPAAALLGVLCAGIVLALGVGGPLLAMRESIRSKTALDQALAAKEAQQTAQAARESAELERDNAERQSYRASLSAAKASIISGDYSEARALLSGTDSNRRGWEWRHLSRLADPSKSTIRSDDAEQWQKLLYDRQGKRFLTFTNNRVVAIDPLTCEQSSLFQRSRIGGLVVAVDRTGRFLISSSGSSMRYSLHPSEQRQRFDIVDVKTGDQIATLQQCTTDIEEFAISANLGLVVGVPVTDYRQRDDNEKPLPIWDLQTGRLERVIGPDREGFMGAFFDEVRGSLFTLSTHRLDQSHYSTGSSIGIRRPDRTTVRVERLTELGDEGIARAELKVWNPRTGELLGFVDDLVGLDKNLAFDQSTGNVLVCKREGWNIYGPKLGLAISNTSESAKIVTGTNDLPECVDFKNTEEIVLGLSSGRVVVASVDGSKNYQQFLGATSVEEVAVDPESGTIAARSGDSIRIWSPDVDGSKPRRFDLASTVDDVNLAPDQGRVYAAYQGSTFQALEIEWGADEWKGRSREITAIAVDQQSSNLALGTKTGEVHFVTQDGKELRTLPTVSGEVSALTWSSDGRMLAIGSSCGEVVVMDAQDARVLMRKAPINNSVSKVIFDTSRGVVFVGYDEYTLDTSEQGVRAMQAGSSNSRVFCFDLQSGNAKWSWPIDASQDHLRTIPESMRAAVTETLKSGSLQISISGSTETPSSSRINVKNVRTGEEWSWDCADPEALMALHYDLLPRASDLALIESKGFLCAAIGGLQLELLDAQNGHRRWSWSPDRKLPISSRDRSAIAIIENPQRLIFADHSSRLHVLEPLKDEPLATISSGVELSTDGVLALEFDAASDSLYACVEGYGPSVVRWETVRSGGVQVGRRPKQGFGKELLRPSIYQLKNSIGSEQTVEFRIQAVGGIQRRYLNSKASYRHPNCFTVVIEADQVAALDSLCASDPTKELLGQIVRVSGKVEERGGQVIIDVTDLAAQLKFVDSAEASKSDTQQ